MVVIRLRGLVPFAVVMVAALLLSSAAHAAPPTAFAPQVTITLDSPNGIVGSFANPTPIMLSDTATVGPSPEVVAGDGTPLGGELQTGVEKEFIDVSSTSLTITIGVLGNACCASGTTNYITGYGPLANYTISGLFAGPWDASLISDSASPVTEPGGQSAGLINFNPAWITVSGDSVSLALDQMQFNTPTLSNTDRFVVFTIDLAPVTAVPEPATLLLTGFGLAALAAKRRRGQRAAAAA